MVTSIVSSLGGGSGLDTAKLVEDLANASRAPKAAMFDQRLKTAQAKISAVAQARSDLESFAKSLSELVAGGTIQSQPTVSDSAALSAVAIPGTRLGNLGSEIVIDQLARAQTVYSGYVADRAAPIGQGTMTLSVGGQDHAITIGASNDSLDGLAAVINASATGVTASVITDSQGARLVLRGQSGSAKAFTLTTADSTLQPLAYGSGGGMTLGQAAQDARFTLDGVAYVRDSNSVGDVFPGVTLTLRKAGPGAPIGIASQRPTETLRQTLNDFVSVFNTLRQDIAAARKSTGGDGSLRALDRQLGALLSAALTGDVDFGSLAAIGIATNRDGTITLDATRFDTALRGRPEAVEALFPALDAALKQIRDSATGAGGPLESLRKRLEKESAAIAKDQERMEARETAYRTRLERQFGTLDSRLSALKATQSYLEQQVRMWTNSES